MENNNYPRFTVIIPQMNRAEYLVHTLKTCMIQDYPNFEIIVGDDCSDDNSVEVVKQMQMQDSRIKLIAHSTHVGMRDNFEKALAAVEPGYVMALGGDDGLTPGCIWRMYEIIKETGTQLLTWKTPTFSYASEPGGRCMLSVRRESFKGYKWVKSEDYLNQISKTLYYLADECPMFYVKGVASTELVDRVKQRTEDHCFYYCPTPDGFSGVVLAGEVDKFIYSNEPLSINGGTIKSQGRAYKNTDKESQKAAKQFFQDSSRKTMHKELASQPYSPLIPLMTADYLLTARDLPGWPGKFEMFSYEHLIRMTFKDLKTSVHSNEVLGRELRILREIAKQHDLLDLFNELYKNTKRKRIVKDAVDGFFVTKNVFDFNASELGISNIYEASLCAQFAYKLCNKVSFSEFVSFVKRNFRVICALFNRKVELMPNIDENE